ncbi:hypothetical protein [Coralloluteibacterium stylophorae]|uniref:Uncharacterized protein n=1 Tax=Coralloluteibacterium stylophorae TaxID=1776034 RepID=A0A8J7VSY5_9GAMM|nr:hypothetical protein [Coralloluteibacterium stylophorae]MBS7456635.1 hypothetical protein [Coralloluteibacterium stylophorae]
MPATSPWTWILACFGLVAGALGVAALWTVLALALGGMSGWMALVAAVDAAILLRLAGVRGHGARAWAAVAGTAATLLLANWFIVAVDLGRALGLRPLEAVSRLGADTAWVFAVHGNGALDWLWMGLSLPLAAWLAR